jgi:hypothetical protein
MADDALMVNQGSIPTKTLTCQGKTWSSEQKGFGLFKRSHLGDDSPVSAW